MTMSPGIVRLAAVAALLLLAGASAFTSTLDETAADSLREGTTRALVTFAAARGLNAALSVAQSAEVGLAAGASATLGVGEVLDPLNDLVEQFADLMLMATVAFGVQEVLLAMGRHELVRYALVALLAIWGAWYAWRGRPPRWLNGLVVLGLMARFAIPLATLGADAAIHGFLEEKYQDSESAITTTADAAREKAAEVPAAEDESWLDIFGDVKRGFDGALDRMDLKAGVEAAVEHVVWLIVVFILQTLVLPLAILWGLFIFARNLVNPGQRPAPAPAEPPRPEF